MWSGAARNGTNSVTVPLGFCYSGLVSSQRIGDARARYLAQLGMDRKARKGRDLGDWLAEQEVAE